MLYFTIPQVQIIQTIKNMQISDAGVALIKKYEGLYLKAYYCPAGLPTISWGVSEYPDGRKVKITDKINLQKAEEVFVFAVNQVNLQVYREVKDLNLNINQYDAIVSFVYNVGINAFKRSTLLKLLKEGEIEKTALEFLKWDKAVVNGKRVRLLGLTKRRQEEKELFLKR
jgi:lysozyme